MIWYHSRPYRRQASVVAIFLPPIRFDTPEEETPEEEALDRLNEFPYTERGGFFYNNLWVEIGCDRDHLLRTIWETMKVIVSLRRLFIIIPFPFHDVAA